MTESAPRSIDQYLRALRAELKDADPALVQDALYDAEEYLRAEVASHAGKSEADVLELIASTYGAPGEVAAAYRTSEATVSAALAPPRRPQARGPLGRFFSVFADSRAWTALFFLLLALPTGILYFVVVVTGLSLSAGLAVLIIGIPFFLLFIGLTRILSLAEGRLVEALLGVRMPRRPAAKPSEATLGGRIKAMLADQRTWTTLLYLVLKLPLGIAYFVASAVGLSLSFGLIASPIMLLVAPHYTSETPMFMHHPMTMPEACLLAVAGVVVLTMLMHLARGLGSLHGHLAKRLLVSRESV